jgi:deoxycytidylate deaminase
MRYLSGEEEQEAKKYLEYTTELAKSATCERSKCGSIIVANNVIIGEGINSPAHNQENQRRCTYDKDSYHHKVTDKTCCIHAEQRAIMDALAHHSDKIIGSRLYFMRLDEEDNLTRAGNPYCTICSKMSLDAGIQEFVLWHEDGICVYDTDEYNLLSYQYKG